MKKLICLLLAVCSLSSAQTYTGEASYYSVTNNGGTKTASGVPLSDSKFTAASNRYALGTIVKITNLANGKSITVKITDRGPFATINGRAAQPLRPHPTRIVDLSLAAAKSIYNLKSGIIRVKTTAIK